MTTTPEVSSAVLDSEHVGDIRGAGLMLGLELVAAAAAGTSVPKGTWVLLTEAVDGGWGLWGHAHTNSELVDAARAQIAELRSKQPG